MFTTVLTIATGAFGGVIVLILTLYFVASLSSIKRGLYQLIPATKREKFIDIAEQISDAVGKYVRGQVVLGLANGVLTLVFLTILGLDPRRPDRVRRPVRLPGVPVLARSRWSERSRGAVLITPRHLGCSSAGRPCSSSRSTT